MKLKKVHPIFQGRGKLITALGRHMFIRGITNTICGAPYAGKICEDPHTVFRTENM